MAPFWQAFNLFSTSNEDLGMMEMMSTFHYFNNVIVPGVMLG
jgi:hypothetical protein